MKLVRAAAAALALFAASPGAAQEPKGGGEILTQMPKELGGAPVQKMPDGSLMYAFTGPSGEPIIVGVLLGDEGEVFPPSQMRSIARSVAGKGAIRKIIREGTFTSARWPGAPTFFGDYQTAEFFHQTWMATTGKRTLMVIVTYDKKKDVPRLEAVVGDGIFGGAVISAGKPTE
jgi:hypothetical protein